MRRPDAVPVDWWTSAFYAPDMLGVAAGFAAAAGILLVGALWNRVESARKSLDKSLDKSPGAASSSAADATFSVDEIPAAVRDLADASRRAVPAWAGAGCMAAGLALLVGSWFAAQQDILPARVAIADGATIQNYEVPHGKTPMTVNLPRRVRLSALQLGDEPSATIQIFQVGDDPAAPPSITRTLPAGAGVDMKGLRLTFSGVRPSEDALRAVLGSAEPNTVAATAGVGDTFRLSLDGPEYKVLDIRADYLDVMGPAVQIESDELGEFWVFQRSSEAVVPPNLGHSIRLTRLESEMAGIFTVAPIQPFWPISLGGTLFVLGFSLLIVFPERIVRIVGRRKIRLWSFHEAGRLAEYVAEQLGDGAVATAAAGTARRNQSESSKSRSNRRGSRRERRKRRDARRSKINRDSQEDGGVE
jgi:hypothetical protein